MTRHVVAHVDPTLPPAQASGMSALDLLLNFLDDSDLTTPDAEGNTPLHLAVKVALGKEDALAETASRLGHFLSRRPRAVLAAAQEIHNSDGLTPFHIASSAGSVKICEVLCHAGAPINSYSLQCAWCMHPGACTLVTRSKEHRLHAGKEHALHATDQTGLHLAVPWLPSQSPQQGPSRHELGRAPPDAFR